MNMAHFKTYPTSTEGYRIELAPKSRLSEILTFLRKYYHNEEALSKSLKLTEGDISDEELKLIEEDEDNMIVTVYESSPCLIAVHIDTNEIVGVILTLLSQRPKEDKSNAASAALFGSQNFKSNFATKYYNYLAQIDTEISIFAKYPNAEIALEIFAIAVHKEHQKKGLAKDLSLTIVEIAKSIPDIGVIFGVYTSIYSKRTAEEIGMNSVLDFDLDQNFTDADGNPIFSRIELDNIIPVMALEIERE